MITTSRYASNLTRKFAKIVSNLFSSRYFSRGKKTIDELAVFSRKIGDERIVVIKEKDGKPTLFDIIEVRENSIWSWLESVGISYEE